MVLKWNGQVFGSLETLIHIRTGGDEEFDDFLVTTESRPTQRSPFSPNWHHHGAKPKCVTTSFGVESAKSSPLS